MKKKWTEEAVMDEILKVMSERCFDRMPSRSEIIETCGNHRLDSAITSNGGYLYFAKKVNATVKNSETKFGVQVEDRILNMISDKFKSVEDTAMRYPYDLLVDSCVKIDVKAARKSFVRGYGVYSFRLAKRQQTCDFYVACPVEGDEIVKVYVIPSVVLHGQVQLCISAEKSKYDKYLDRWDLVSDMSHYMSEVCV